MAKNHKANQPLNPKTMAKPELLQSLSSLSSLQTQDVVKLSTSLNLEPPPHYFILLRTPRHKAFHCTVATPTVRCLLRRDTPLPTSGSWRFIRQNLTVSGETWLWFLPSSSQGAQFELACSNRSRYHRSPTKCPLGSVRFLPNLTSSATLGPWFWYIFGFPCSHLLILILYAWFGGKSWKMMFLLHCLYNKVQNWGQFYN